jgi:hypothetical protein
MKACVLQCISISFFKRYEQERVRDAQIYMKKQFRATHVSGPVWEPLLWLTRP